MRESQVTESARLARDYGESKRALGALVEDLEGRVRALKREAMPGIRVAAQKAARRRERIEAFVWAHPELFARPRTRTFDGVRIGFRKRPDRVEVEDSARAIALIRERFPHLVGALVKTTHRLLVGALKRLPAADLEALGATVLPGADEVVVEHPDSELDSLVQAYLDDRSLQDVEEAA